MDKQTSKVTLLKQYPRFGYAQKCDYLWQDEEGSGRTNGEMEFLLTKIYSFISFIDKVLFFKQIKNSTIITANYGADSTDEKYIFVAGICFAKRQSLQALKQDQKQE